MATPSDIAARTSSGNSKVVGSEYPLPTSTIPHLRIHEGKFFHASYLIPHASPIADNASVEVLVVTGSDIVHLLTTVNTGGDVEAYIFEGTAVTDNGTLKPSYNNRRTGTPAPSTANVYQGPTVTDVGSQLGDGILIPGGSGPQSSGGSQTPDHEIMLAPNTNYLFRVTNVSGGALQFSIEMGWYELTQS